jgi:MFS family permease
LLYEHTAPARGFLPGGMALLDIQIVASSLQYIGGGLSAAQEEISWVQTAYLIAEIVVIPMVGRQPASATQ